MRTIVITGGTDGMGAALAHHYLRAGDRVVAIGRDRAKFETLVAKASATGGGDAGPPVAARAEFLAADLSSVAEARRTVGRLTERHPRIDALVLAASFVRRRRHLTPEGHEASWALFFLSKYLLVTGVAPVLAAAARPVVVNAAVPGARPDAIDFEDPGMATGFTFARSNAQQRRANELLGVLATGLDPDLAYVTWGPARLVRSGFAGEFGTAARLGVTVLGGLLGQRPATAVRPLVRLLDDPAPGRAAYRGGTRRPLAAGPREAEECARLTALVEATL
ncbi:SDR family NAD(P)-dependent oxidoreductase [Streptomyces sp. NPDC002454]